MTAVPIQHPAASRHALRQSLTALIHKLIGALDVLDGDADFEETGDDEPSLGFQEARQIDSQDNILKFTPIGGDQFTDLEVVCEDEGAEHDGREPETHDGTIEYASDHDQTRLRGGGQGVVI